MYDGPDGIPVDVPLTTVLRQLLIDVDPGLVPLWVTLLGMTAHAMFLGGFLLLVGLGMYDYKRSRLLQNIARRRNDPRP